MFHEFKQLNWLRYISHTVELKKGEKIIEVRKFAHLPIYQTPYLKPRGPQ